LAIDDGGGGAGFPCRLLAAFDWLDVKAIVCDAINQAGFEPNLVGNADDIGVIQKRIVQNPYDNPIVVVDISARNPNVMFELGMRLAFDKPTIVVKDDKTPYAFDTSPIEHVEYPRDLRFQPIVDFKTKLAAKIVATHKSAMTDSNYTTFLKHFGEFAVAKLDKKEVWDGCRHRPEFRSACRYRDTVTRGPRRLRQRAAPARGCAFAAGPARGSVNAAVIAMRCSDQQCGPRSDRRTGMPMAHSGGAAQAPAKQA
jgi:hypothetical protein